MARQHSSFLIRCWRLDGEIERIEIEHIQSGEKTLAISEAEAVAWLCGHGAQARNALGDKQEKGDEAEQSGGVRVE